MAKPWTLFLSTSLLSFSIYVFTLSPTITWRNDGFDSGDLATAVAVGGVPHPPGYPTYLVLGEVFQLLPFGDVAYRLNLLSAACAALSVSVVGLIIYHTLSKTSLPPALSAKIETNAAKNRIWLCATSATLTLAFSGVFWSQAVIAEVYALNALFTALLLYGAIHVQPTNARWLVPGLFAVLGLSLGNHPSILLLLPSLVWLMKVRWHWRQSSAVLLAFCAGLCVYLIIPIRAAASPTLNWGMATSLPNFLWLVSAQLYRHFLFALPWNSVPGRIASEFHSLTAGFAWWALPASLLGLWTLSRRSPSLSIGSLIAFVLTSIYSIGYNTTDSYVYLLPAFLLYSFWVGWGLHNIADALQRLKRLRPQAISFVSLGILLLPLSPLALNLPHQATYHMNEDARSYAQQSLELVAPGAIIITDNDPQTFALWYGRYGLALRPDVAIINVNLLPYAWYRQSLRQTHANLRLSDEEGQPLTTLSDFIDRNVSRSPIYLASLRRPTPQDHRLSSSTQLQRIFQTAAD